MNTIMSIVTWLLIINAMLLLIGVFMATRDKWNR